MEGDFTLLLVVGMLGFAMLSGAIAAEKNRTFFGWAALGLLFGPITVLVLAAIPKVDPESDAPALAAASTADELAKLADLHASGALDDAEFAAAKARLLT